MARLKSLVSQVTDKVFVHTNHMTDQDILFITAIIANASITDLRMAIQFDHQLKLTACLSHNHSNQIKSLVPNDSSHIANIQLASLCGIDDC